MRIARLFRHDERGSIAVTSAVVMTALLGFTALGVDVGSVYTARRKAQSVADLAVIAAVSDIANAETAARNTIAANNLPGATFDLEYGTYTADPAVAADKRFVPSAAVYANAARVTVRVSTPLFFARVTTGRDTFDIQTTATASHSSLAAFSIGSGLLKVDSGVINSVLGSLLGTSLSLSVMDYNALIGLRLDAFSFLSALATQLRLTGVSYDTVLATTVNRSDVLNAMLAAATAQYGSNNGGVIALKTIVQATQGAASRLKLPALLNPGPYGGLGVGAKPGVSASLSAFDMLMAAAEIANGTNQVAATLNTGIPGIASATLKVAIGERPVGTSWVTFGSAGATVHTAQTRILLDVKVAGTGQLSLVRVPLYIEIASGTATLTDLKCGFPDIATSTATLAVRPGVVDAWIGDVSDSRFSNFSFTSSPPAATLVDLPGLQVSGSAHVSVSDINPTSVTFSYSDIQSYRKKTVSTSAFTSSLVSSLLGQTRITVNALGIGLTIPGVSSAVAAVLSTATGPIDQLLASVLQTIGVGLGQADVGVSNIRCDGAVLVI